MCLYTFPPISTPTGGTVNVPAPVTPEPLVALPPLRFPWICGRCDGSNAPHVDRCPCSPQLDVTFTPLFQGGSLPEEKWVLTKHGDGSQTVEPEEDRHTALEHADRPPIPGCLCSTCKARARMAAAHTAAQGAK